MADRTAREPTGCGADRPDGSVHSDSIDAMVVADWDARMPQDECAEKSKVFEAFVLAHAACATDLDCSVIGDCGPNADFRAIQRSAAVEGSQLMEQRCEQAYDGPVFDAVCKAGVCSREERTDTCCGCVANEAGP